MSPENVTAIIDTREQLPLDLAPLRTVTRMLTTGDYSVVGLEKVVSVERKSLVDLVQCVGRDRKRFDREVQRLLAYPVRAIVVEASWSEIERGDWRSQVKPSQVTGSVLGWIARGIPILLIGDHEAAGRAVSRLLLIAARRRWAEASALVRCVQEQTFPVG